MTSNNYYHATTRKAYAISSLIWNSIVFRVHCSFAVFIIFDSSGGLLSHEPWFFHQTSFCIAPFWALHLHSLTSLSKTQCFSSFMQLMITETVQNYNSIFLNGKWREVYIPVEGLGHEVCKIRFSIIGVFGPVSLLQKQTCRCEIRRCAIVKTCPYRRFLYIE